MGQTFELEDGTKRSGGTSADLTLDVPSRPDPRQRDRQTESDIMGAYRDELVILRRQMTELDQLSTSEVMLVISSVAARLSEMRSDLWDMRHPHAQHLRTRHVDPLRNDLELHFKAHSRRISDLELDWKMAHGQ